MSCERVLRSLGVVVCVAALAGCGAAARKPSATLENVIRAPAGIAALAQQDADGILAAVKLPAGAQAANVVPRGVRSELIGIDLARPYASFREQTRYWTVSAASVGQLLAAPPAGGTSYMYGHGNDSARFASWSLPAAGRWIGARYLELIAAPDPSDSGRWFVEVQADVIWTAEVIDLPQGIASVTIRAIPGGRLVLNETAPQRVAAIVAAVNALPVDDAVNAVFSCPAMRIEGGEIELLFRARGGRVLATAYTALCPDALSLSVPGSGHQLRTLTGFVLRLDRIVQRSLPVGRL
jgi:hypothetical protein